MIDIILECLKSASGIIFGFFLAMGIGWWQLKKGHFWGRVTYTHVSLNSDNKIILDTLLDKRAVDVWIDNALLRNRIRKAAEICTNQNPFVVLESSDDQHKISQGIRNQLSAHFSRGVVYNAFDRNIEECTFYYVLCSLDSPTDKSKKLHTIVFTEKLLSQLRNNLVVIKQENKDKSELIEILMHVCDDHNKNNVGHVRIYLPKDIVVETKTHNYKFVDVHFEAPNLKPQPLSQTTNRKGRV